MLCALVSPTDRFHLFVYFTHLQISPACRFHPLADFTPFRFHLLVDLMYRHLPCVMSLMISVVCIRCNVILTHCFLSPVTAEKKISPTMLCALVSPTCRFHLLVYFTHLQISPACRFHPFADFTHFFFLVVLARQLHQERTQMKVQ